MLRLKKEGKRLVFTNGCFDLLHPGHVRYLEKARTLGDFLVVALNSDDSMRKLKGRGRPILRETERSEVISGLGCVDFVTTFEEETPQEMVEELLPDVLVKGGDWSKTQIVGSRTVESRGGQVVAVNFEEGFATSNIIERIRASDSSRSRR